MKKHVGILSAIAVSILFGAVLVANAQSNPFAIEFPIAELGGCGSVQECKVFCDSPANGEACFAFAQSRGLVKGDDVKKHDEDKKFNEQRRTAIEKKGAPGGCTSEKSCKEFCSDPNNGDECLAFARKNQIRPKEELDQIESDLEQVKTKEKAVRAGGGPGGCSSRETCNAFCKTSANRQTCFDFAKEHDLISQEELAQIEQQINQPQTGPGGCASREECDTFCRTPKNVQICLDFAVGQGQITAQQAQQFKQFQTSQGGGRTRPQVRGPQIRGPEVKINEEKARQLLETTGGPGGCASFEECGTFCSTPENQDTCFEFAKSQGLMEAQDVERIDKVRKAQGPGGCRGRQCEQFCEAAGHEEECLNFAIDNGLVPQEEVERAKKFIDVAKKGGPGGCRGRQCEDFCSQPENQEQCFAFAKENQLIPQEEVQRIEKLQTTIKSGGGPGGCTSEQTCRSHCSDPSHFEECAGFAVGAGLVKPEEAMMQLEQFAGAEDHQGSGLGQSGQQGFGQGQGGGQRFGGFNRGPQGFGQEQQGQGNQQGFGVPGEQGFGQGQQQGSGRPGDQGSQGGPQGVSRGVDFEQERQQQFEQRFKQFEQFKNKFQNNTGGQGQGFPGGPRSDEQGGFHDQGQGTGGEVSGSEAIEGNFPGRGSTEGNFPGGGATGGNFPGGQGVPPGGAGSQGRVPTRTQRPPVGGSTGREGQGRGGEPFDIQGFKNQLENQQGQDGGMPQGGMPSRGSMRPGMGNTGTSGRSGTSGSQGEPGMQGFGGEHGGFDQQKSDRQGFDFPGQGGTQGQFPGGGATGGNFPEGSNTQGSFPGGGATGGTFPGSGQGLPSQANPSGSFGQPGQPGSGFPPPGGGFQPPTGGTTGGTMPPPTGSFGTMPPPSGSFTQPSGGTMMPPPSGSGSFSGGSMPPPSGDSGGMMPPPSGSGGGGMPPPGAFGDITHAFATVLGALLRIFR